MDAKVSYREIRFKQHDTGHKLYLKVIASGKGFSLAEYDAVAFFQLPNGKPLEQRNGTIEGNIVTIDLDNYLLSESGTVKFEVELHKGNEITTTFRMQYVVEESFDTDGAVTTQPHWDIINRLVDVTPEHYVTREEYQSLLLDVESGLPVDLTLYTMKTDLSKVATSGNYIDLEGKPTKLSQFVNDLDIPTGGGTGGGTVINGSGYGVIKNGDNLISARQANDVLEIEGEGIDVQLQRYLSEGSIYDKIRLVKTPTYFQDVLSKPFSSLSSDFIVDEDGIVSVDRNKVGGSAGGGMPFINIMSFKVWEVINNEYVEVTYSALGDNFTSGSIDTLAIERAFRLAKDNGSVNIYIPDGKFILNQTIQLYPNTNVTMSRNAVIRKNHDHPMFSNSQPNEWFLGYSGRGKIYWTGGTLDCKDATGKAREGSTFSLVNAEYFEFKSIIFLDQRNTHHFDLSGIRNIVMNECYFYGYTYDVVDANGVAIPTDKIRAYSECIQLDYSSHQAMPSQNTGHDGTACQFVFVQRCKFDKSDTYPSWNRSVGMHNVYFPTYNWICNTDGTLTGNNFNFEYSKAKNMYITDNEIYGNGTITHDYYTIDSTTGEKIYDPEGFIIQQIRLLNVDNVYISGNKFDSTKGGISFDCDQSSKTMIDTDAQRDFATNNSGHLMPYSVEWTDKRGDKQIILYSESTSDKGTKITTYTQYGKTYKITWAKTSKVLDYYGISNCHVINNTFKNITAGVKDTNGVTIYQPSTPIYVRGECRTKASATLQGTRANKVIVMGNIIDGIDTVPVELQSRQASAKGLTVSPSGTTGASWTPNIVSAISATYTRNLTVIGNEIRNCSRAIYTSGCNRGLIANNQIFTIVDTEAICVVGGGIYLVTGNIMDNMYDSAIRMKGTDQFFVEGNIITNPNKGATWQIDVPFFLYNPKDKPTIWVEVDGSGGSNYGSVSNNKIYTSFTSNFIKYPIYIGDENSYVKSSGNFYFGTYQFKNNTDLNFSNCGLDIAFRGNDAETLNGKSVDGLKDIFVQHTDKNKANGVAGLGSDGKLDITLMPTAVTSNQGGFKQFRIMPQPEVVNGVPEDVLSSATTLINFVGEDGIYLDVVDGNTIKVKYKFADQVSHIASNDLAIENLKQWQSDNVNPHINNNDKHVTLPEKTAWNGHMDTSKTIAQGGSADIHVTQGQKDGWNNHKDNSDIHVTKDQKDSWDSKISHIQNTDIPALDARLDTLESTDVPTINSKLDQITNTDIPTLDSRLDGLDGVGGAIESLDYRLDALDGTGGAIENINNDISTNYLNKNSATPQTVKPEVQFNKNVSLSSYKEVLTTTTGTLDLSLGSVFYINTPTSTVTLTIANAVLSTSYVHSIVVYITFGASLQTINMPTGTKWHLGTPPTYKANKTHEILLRTINGGTAWLASMVGEF